MVVVLFVRTGKKKIPWSDVRRLAPHTVFLLLIHIVLSCMFSRSYARDLSLEGLDRIASLNERECATKSTDVDNKSKRVVASSKGTH